MEFWIARTEDNELSLHTVKPVYKIDEYDRVYYWNGGRIGELPITSFPEVTFENSPQKVELKIIENGLVSS